MECVIVFKKKKKERVDNQINMWTVDSHLEMMTLISNKINKKKNIVIIYLVINLIFFVK
jgi:hypothetical protein